MHGAQHYVSLPKGIITPWRKRTFFPYNFTLLHRLRVWILITRVLRSKSLFLTYVELPFKFFNITLRHPIRSQSGFPWRVSCVNALERVLIHPQKSVSKKLLWFIVKMCIIWVPGSLAASARGCVVSKFFEAVAKVGESLLFTMILVEGGSSMSIFQQRSS